MKNISTALLMCLFLGQAFAQEVKHQHEHEQQHQKSLATGSPEKGDHSARSLSLNHGKKWPVDQTMRENMGAIHRQFKILKDLSKSKKATDKEAKELSDLISTSAQNIVSKCKMEAAQDENFHIILSELFVVADSLKKKKEIEPALSKLAETFKNYTKYFEHVLEN
jgi:aspartate oxidase